MIFIIASCVLHCCKLIWIYKFSFTGQFTKSIFCHTLKSSAHVFLLFQKKCVTLHSIFEISGTKSYYGKSHCVACLSSLSQCSLSPPSGESLVLDTAQQAQEAPGPHELGPCSWRLRSSLAALYCQGGVVTHS